ncbi:MAG TPA: galactose-1-phosphate uridylyltransferase [Chitinispirillaceae bacterium]|nr:galactose-1-phosphate uridylyltransferase [Chitinispirillaceae bacterium]
MTVNTGNETGSFIRQDPISREWVIYAPSRGKRPHDLESRPSKRQMMDYDECCPFCPGNEHMLSTIKCELMDDIHYAWICRAISNRYPVLSSGNKLFHRRDGMFLCMGGYGYHEVIIDNPHHGRDIPQYTRNEYFQVIEMYHRRYNEMMKDPKVAMVTIFRNHGTSAGTSLTHPHSQIIGSPTVPLNIRIQEQFAQVYFDDYGTCAFCDLIKSELSLESRIIHQNRSFVAFVPYAASVPYEVWILPRRHTAVFGDINEDEKKDTALILQEILHRIYITLDDPDYNYIIHSFTRFKAEEPHLHWFIRIVPRLLTPAGFELGSGFMVNPSIPEEDAELLRGK